MKRKTIIRLILAIWLLWVVYIITSGSSLWLLAFAIWTMFVTLTLLFIYGVGIQNGNGRTGD
jgi:hypothetical protein